MCWSHGIVRFFRGYSTNRAVVGTRLIFRSRQFFLEIHDLFDLHQKLAVNFCEVENLLDGEAGAQGVAELVSG